MNKVKRCRNCSAEFEPKKPLQVVCNYSCALELEKKRQAKKDAKEWKSRKKEGKEKLKTYAQRVGDVKKIFQKWVRKRDKDLPCISCGNTGDRLWDGGHYKKSELYRGVIFNEDNVHKQCRKCNSYLDGNEANYRNGLVERIGEKRVKALEQLAELTKKKRYSAEELLEIKNKYLKLLKE